MKWSFPFVPFPFVPSAFVPSAFVPPAFVRALLVAFALSSAACVGLAAPRVAMCPLDGSGEGPCARPRDTRPSDTQIGQAEEETASAEESVDATAAEADVSDELECALGTLRVMPLGDSITEGAMVPGAYRTELWRRAALDGIGMELVGTRQNGPLILPQRHHEGHPGWRIAGIDDHVDTWLTATSPDVVLLMIGTNDMLSADARATAPDRLAKLLDRIAIDAPDAHILVATLPPLGPKFGNQVSVFNHALPPLVAARAMLGKHVTLVDMEAALTGKDLLDEIHPSEQGYEKMARVWFSALKPIALSSRKCVPAPSD